jgi:hypothetical protein
MIGNYNGTPNQPLFNLNGGGTSGQDIEVTTNFAAFKDTGNFSDIIQIQKTRDPIGFEQSKGVFS